MVSQEGWVLERLAEIKHAAKIAPAMAVDVLVRSALKAGIPPDKVAEAADYRTDVPSLWTGVRCDQCNRKMEHIHVWINGLFPVCSDECAQEIRKAFANFTAPLEED